MNEEPINGTDEMIEKFIEECETEAAKLEITVDYYLPEFIWHLLPYQLDW